MYRYTIAHEDGTVSTFNSKRVFEWAVVVKDFDEKVATSRWISQPWGVYRKSSTRAGVEAQAREASGIVGANAFEKVLIVRLEPVEITKAKS